MTKCDDLALDALLAADDHQWDQLRQWLLPDELDGVEGDRLWYITNRAEIVCLDTAGFDTFANTYATPLVVGE